MFILVFRSPWPEQTTCARALTAASLCRGDQALRSTDLFPVLLQTWTTWCNKDLCISSAWSPAWHVLGLKVGAFRRWGLVEERPRDVCLWKVYWDPRLFLFLSSFQIPWSKEAISTLCFYHDVPAYHRPQVAGPRAHGPKQAIPLKMFISLIRASEESTINKHGEPEQSLKFFIVSL